MSAHRASSSLRVTVVRPSLVRKLSSVCRAMSSLERVFGLAAACLVVPYILMSIKLHASSLPQSGTAASVPLDHAWRSSGLEKHSQHDFFHGFPPGGLRGASEKVAQTAETVSSSFSNFLEPGTGSVLAWLKQKRQQHPGYFLYGMSPPPQPSNEQEKYASGGTSASQGSIIVTTATGASERHVVSPLLPTNPQAPQAPQAPQVHQQNPKMDPTTPQLPLESLTAQPLYSRLPPASGLPLEIPSLSAPLSPPKIQPSPKSPPPPAAPEHPEAVSPTPLVVKATRPPSRCLLFTMDSIDNYVARAAKGGASGEITIRESLVARLRTVLNVDTDVAHSDRVRAFSKQYLLSASLFPEGCRAASHCAFTRPPPHHHLAVPRQGV